MEILIRPTQTLLEVANDVFRSARTIVRVTDRFTFARTPPEGSALLGPATEEMLAVLIGCDTIMNDLLLCKKFLKLLDEGRTPCGRRLDTAGAIIQTQMTEKHQAKLRGLFEVFVGLFDGALGGEYPGHPAEGEYTLTAEQLIYFVPSGPVEASPALSILGLSPDACD